MPTEILPETPTQIQGTPQSSPPPNTSPSTPPSLENTPAASTQIPPVNPEIAFMQNVILNQQARLREFENQQRQAPPPPPAAPTVTDQDFMNSPAAANRQLIREEVSALVDPLRQFVAQNQRTTEYTNSKNLIFSQADFFPYRAKLEPYLDASFNQGMNPDQNTVMFAANAILGNLFRTDPSFRNPVPTQQITNQPVVTQQQYVPPSIPSNSHPNFIMNQNADPNDFQKPNGQPWTENELRLIREGKMTKKEYWELGQNNSMVMQDKRRGS